MPRTRVRVCRSDAVPDGAVVADVMLRRPRVCAADTSVADARAMFADDHLHALLVVGSGVLLAVVERPDLERADGRAPAHEQGRLAGRVVGPDADLVATWRAMVGRRRLAVVDPQGALLGLLCLKRSGRGFCSQADVDARARERGADGSLLPLRVATAG
ncbi:CBS domain-containing protein [Actinomycetospora sp. NBC_00405]|uniref:CBS domain-containing protein n=1 Tax=Actinomycetospora sp. NBC_00405 TaxID=2975952 RepID=UPI002E1DC942